MTPLTPNQLMARGQDRAKADPRLGALRWCLPSRGAKRGFDIVVGTGEPRVFVSESTDEATGAAVADSYLLGCLRPLPPSLRSPKAVAGWRAAVGARACGASHIVLPLLSRCPIVSVGVRAAGFSGDVTDLSFGLDASASGQASINAQISAAGIDESKLQQAALSAGLSLSDFYKLQSAVTSPKDLAASLSAVVNQDALAQAGLHALGGSLPEGTMSNLMGAGKSLLSGDLMGSVGPIVATVMTATGVGAPLVGAVGAGIALGEAALNALGIGQAKGQTCGWSVNAYCGNGTRPYGPKDPTWVPLGRVIGDKRYASSFPVPGGYWPITIGGAGKGPVGYGIDPYYATIASELKYLEGHGPNLQTTPAAKDGRLNAFRLAFYRAYLGQLERAINGQQPVDPGSLLNQTALQWNASHAGPGVVVSSADVPDYWSGGNVDNKTGVVMGGDNGAHPGVFKQTYVERLLAGKIDGSRRPPLSVNVGPLLQETPQQKQVAALTQVKKVVPLHLGAPLATHDKVAVAAKIAASGKTESRPGRWAAAFFGALGAGWAGLRVTGHPLGALAGAVGGALGGWWAEKEVSK